jgi:hypothetical protein
MAQRPNLGVLASDDGQIACLRNGHNLEMEENNTPRIIEALRMKDGVLITFEDGKSAIYSAALLYAVFPKKLKRKS